MGRKLTLLLIAEDLVKHLLMFKEDVFDAGELMVSKEDEKNANLTIDVLSRSPRNLVNFA